MKKYIFYSMVLFLAVAQYKTIVYAAKRVATSTPKAATKVEIKEKPEEKPKEKLSTSPKIIDWPAVEKKVGPHLKGIPGLAKMVVEYAKFSPEEIKKATEQLLDAINESDIESVKNAIRNGADVNNEKELGYGYGHDYRPLGFALMALSRGQGKLEIFEILLANNANPDRISPGLRSISWLLSEFTNIPAYHYLEDDFNKVLDLLLNNGATIEKGDLARASKIDVSALPAKMLLDKGADVNEEDEKGITPIMVAANRDNAELVKLLLQRGANPNAKGFDVYLPPLFGAAKAGNLEMVKSLIENGADVNSTHNYEDNDLTTPLMVILQYYYPEDKKGEEILQLLLEKGADVNFRPGPKNYSFLEIINQNPEFKRLKEIYEQFEKKKAETKTEIKRTFKKTD